MTDTRFQPDRASAWLELAQELQSAREAYLKAVGDPIPQAHARQALLQLLWDDKGTIIELLRRAASLSGGEAVAPLERLWCQACGTVTRDERCDCNRYGVGHKMYREPNLVNYADEMQKTAHELSIENEQLRAVLPSEAQWAAEWHQTVETMMTMAGLSCALSPSESLAEFQQWLAALPSEAIGREWQDISTAPLEIEFIGQDSDGRVFNCRCEADDCGENWYDVHGDQLSYPIRWMPLPPSSVTRPTSLSTDPRVDRETSGVQA